MLKRAEQRLFPAILSRVGIPVLALGALLWLPLAAASPDQGSATTRGGTAEGEIDVAGRVQVILVRHAEKELDGGSDPELAAAGLERAEHLCELLSQAGVSRFFASQYQRSQDTLLPLAKLAQAEVEVIPAQDPGALVETLRGLPPGTVAAVAGHSNTIPDLIQRLGARPERLNERGWLPDEEYTRLYVMTLPVGPGPRGPATLLELRF